MEALPMAVSAAGMSLGDRTAQPKSRLVHQQHRESQTCTEQWHNWEHRCVCVSTESGWGGIGCGIENLCVGQSICVCNRAFLCVIERLCVG